MVRIPDRRRPVREGRRKFYRRRYGTNLRGEAEDPSFRRPLGLRGTSPDHGSADPGKGAPSSSVSVGTVARGFILPTGAFG